MKLLRVGEKGAEKPALLHSDGTYRDLSSVVPDITGKTIDAAGLAKIKAADPSKLPVHDSMLRIGPCVGNVGKFICVGLNYADHAAESNMPIPSEPILFMKATSAIIGPNDTVVVPKNSTKCDWEVELGVVIGKETRYVDEKDALGHVAGYCVINDLSERAFQKERGGQWVKGKSADTFGPLGPWLVTADEVPDPQGLGLRLWVNGALRQDGSTKNMIFGVAHIVWYLSQVMVLRPGDVINTGTPAGVGMARQRYLRPGDVTELEIAGLGRQRQRFVPAP